MNRVVSALRILNGIIKTPRLLLPLLAYILLDLLTVFLMEAFVPRVLFLEVVCLLVFVGVPFLQVCIPDTRLLRKPASGKIAPATICVMVTLVVSGVRLGLSFLIVLVLADLFRIATFIASVETSPTPLHGRFLGSQSLALIRAGVGLVAVSLIFAPFVWLRIIIATVLCAWLLCIAVEFAIEPIVDYLWVCWRMRRMCIPVSTYYWKGRIGEYLEDNTLYVEDGLIYQAALSCRRDKQDIYGFSIGFGLRTGPAVRRLEALNTAACELYERFVTAGSKIQNRNVNSNGVALHGSLEEAKRRSRLELLERDSVMAHYYTSRPALSRFDLRALRNIEGVSDSLRVVGAISWALDSAWGFKLYSPSPETNIYWVLITHNGCATSGWSTGSHNDTVALTKAFAEAVSVSRFRSKQENKHLLARLCHRGFSSITHDNFLGVCEELNITNTDLQCLLISGKDPIGANLSFLHECSAASSISEFLRTGEDVHWYVCPHVEYDVLAQPVKSPFQVVRARSEAAFQIDWPTVTLSEIVSTSRRKGIEHELGPNKDALCIVY